MKLAIQSKLICFKRLQSGTVFLAVNQYGDCHPMMVLHSSTTTEANAVCLTDGKLLHVLPEYKVQKIKGCVVVKTPSMREVIGI